MLEDLKQVIESYGVSVSPALYEQLDGYFDLDRTDNLYMRSFLEYMKASSLQKFNYFKVHSSVVCDMVKEQIKNSVESVTLDRFEDEMRAHYLQLLPPGQPVSTDPLLVEKIAGKVLSLKLERFGLPICMWEIYSLLDYINTYYAKWHYEPQRYHFISYSLFHKFMTNRDFE